MIAHLVLIEKVHLFLNRTIYAWITRMQTDNEFATIVKLFHQGELLFKGHRSGTAYRNTLFST